MTATSIRVTFKRKFITGLFVSIPVIITTLVIARFFRFVDGLLKPIYYRFLSGGIAAPHRIGESGE